MKTFLCIPVLLLIFLVSQVNCQTYQRVDEYNGNPIISDYFTADPSALVHNGRLYIYAGRDAQSATGDFFLLDAWVTFSTDDLVNWTDHGVTLRPNAFSWSRGQAFAADVLEYHGKFYWFVPTLHRTVTSKEGFAIGVAVSESPTGSFRDALGDALITDDTPNSIDLNIDPDVFVDDDGKIYMFWGSWGAGRYVEITIDNETETVALAGEVQTLNTRNFFEAPWIHKRGDIYYLSYAVGYPSTIGYATSSSIHGPWTYRGIINEFVNNSETNHQAIVEFKDKWYFIYHNGALPGGGVYRRSVCIDTLGYNSDGTIKPIIQTTQGVRRVITVDDDTRAGIYRGSGSFVDSLWVLETQNAENWNLIQGIEVGQTVFGDRDFTFASVPQFSNEVEWIQTAMNSRTNSSLNNFATVKIKEDGFLYIAYANRVEEKPHWLSEYELTNLEIIVNENETTQRVLSLHRKSVSAGEDLDLGVNSNDATAYSLMYIPIFTNATTGKTDKIFEQDISLEITPNPFNPIAQISFYLPKQAFVSLDVFDVTGKKVRSLLNENLTSGKHTNILNASSLSSGVYFVRLNANNILLQKRVVILK